MSHYNHAEACRANREAIAAMYAATQEQRERALAARICAIEKAEGGQGKAFLARFRLRHGNESYTRLRGLCLQTWSEQRAAA